MSSSGAHIAVSANLAPLDVVGWGPREDPSRRVEPTLQSAQSLLHSMGWGGCPGGLALDGGGGRSWRETHFGADAGGEGHHVRSRGELVELFQIAFGQLRVVLIA